jgi:signal transduction histidine kinase
MFSAQDYRCGVSRWMRSSSIRLAAEAATAFLASAAFFALAAVGTPLRHELVFVLVLGGVYGYVVLAAARRFGPLYGVPFAIAAGLAFDSFYIPPTRDFGSADWQNWLVVAIYLLLGVLIGMLGSYSQRRAEVSEQARGLLAQEQAALRRVATLVARGERPEVVFAAVGEEVGVLLGVDGARVIRYVSDDEILQLEGWVAQGNDRLPVGPMKVEGTTLAGEVLRTGRAVRIEDYESANRPVPSFARGMGIRAGVAAPIVVDGQLWGAMLAWSLRPRSLPDDAESRLAAFTELVATTISNTASREELALLAREQAALRRVATLVAMGVPPDDVFAAVAKEVGQLIPSSETAVMLRYEADGTVTVMALWAAGKGREAIEAASNELGIDFRPGARVPLDDVSVPALVLRTKRPARMEDTRQLSGPIAALNRAAGIRFVAGAPIVVDGRLWGVMLTATTETEPVPMATESRIAEFTELVAAAISNAETRAELTASRVRIVTAADETRRRIERDLHDGTQQRLVSLALELRTAEATIPPQTSEFKARLSSIAEGLAGAVEDLQEISRGIHPAILSRGGLGPALKGLARRSSLPVELEAGVLERLPHPVETAAYYVVSEALANATKHASASAVEVRLEVRDATLHMSIRDDGAGGADPSQGSGLLGLIDRVEALGGTIAVTSPPGQGTSMVLELPVELH